MSNDIQYLKKQKYLNKIEENLHMGLVMNDVAEDVSGNFDGNGSTLNLPSVAYMQTQNYTPYTSVTFRDITSGNSQLVIDKFPMVPFKYDRIDEALDSYDVLERADSDSSYKLKQKMESDFWAQYTNARFGNGTAAALTSSTAFNIVSTGLSTLSSLGIKKSDMFIALDAYMIQAVGENAISSTFALSDYSFERGYIGRMLSSAPIYQADCLSGTTALDLATNPSDGDTFTWKSLTFTMKTVLGTTAGNILIGAAATNSRDNIVAALTNAAGAGTTYVAFSQDLQDLLYGTSATNTANTVAITCTSGYYPFSSTFTNASNDFQAYTAYALIGQRGAIKVAYRNGLQMDVTPTSDNLVRNYFVYGMWGLKVTDQGAKRLYKLAITSQAAEA